jgi:predicted nucleic-acid-binding protein
VCRVVEALELAASRNVDFLDAVLAVEAAAAQENVCTFDAKDFKRLPGSWVSPD